LLADERKGNGSLGASGNYAQTATIINGQLNRSLSTQYGAGAKLFLPPQTLTSVQMDMNELA
jgi:hypothetical protein